MDKGLNFQPYLCPEWWERVVCVTLPSCLVQGRQVFRAQKAAFTYGGLKSVLLNRLGVSALPWSDHLPQCPPSSHFKQRVKGEGRLVHNLLVGYYMG